MTRGDGKVPDGKNLKTVLSYALVLYDCIICADRAASIIKTKKNDQNLNVNLCSGIPDARMSTEPETPQFYGKKLQLRSAESLCRFQET